MSSQATTQPDYNTQPADDPQVEEVEVIQAEQKPLTVKSAADVILVDNFSTAGDDDDDDDDIVEVFAPAPTLAARLLPAPDIVEVFAPAPTPTLAARLSIASQPASEAAPLPLPTLRLFALDLISNTNAVGAVSALAGTKENNSTYAALLAADIVALDIRNSDAPSVVTALQPHHQLVASASMGTSTTLQLFIAQTRRHCIVTRNDSSKSMGNIWQTESMSSSGVGGAGAHVLIHIDGIDLVVCAFSLASRGTSAATLRKLAPSIPGDSGIRDEWSHPPDEGVTVDILRKMQSTALCYATERIAKQAEIKIFGKPHLKGWFLPAIAFTTRPSLNHPFESCGPSWDSRLNNSILLRTAEFWRDLSDTVGNDIYSKRLAEMRVTQAAIEAIGTPIFRDYAVIDGGAITSTFDIIQGTLGGVWEGEGASGSASGMISAPSPSLPPPPPPPLPMIVASNWRKLPWRDGSLPVEGDSRTNTRFLRTPLVDKNLRLSQLTIPPPIPQERTLRICTYNINGVAAKGGGATGLRKDARWTSPGILSVGLTTFLGAFDLVLLQEVHESAATLRSLLPNSEVRTCSNPALTASGEVKRTFGVAALLRRTDTPSIIETARVTHRDFIPVIEGGGEVQVQAQALVSRCHRYDGLLPVR